MKRRLNRRNFILTPTIMLKKKQAGEVIAKRFKGIRAHLRAFRKTRDPEEIHRLRVEIKKLRAMLLLEFDALDSGNLPKPFRAVKKLFKEAAEIRTPHVNLQLLDKFKIPGDVFRKNQQAVLTAATEKFRKKTGSYLDDLRPAKKHFLRKLKDIDDKHIRNMAVTQLDQLTAIFAAKDPLQFHECRKKLKNLLYIHASLDKKTAAKLKLGKMYLVKLQQLIGEWHDILDTRTLLTKARSKDKALSGKLREEAARLEKQVFSLTKGFRGKASKL